MVSCILKVPKAHSREEDMSQEPQEPDELQAPPLLAQLASILVSILVCVGFAVGMNIVLPELPENFGYIVLYLIAIFGTAVIGYYLTISGLSRLFTDSWGKYPKMVKNIPD